MTTGQPLRKYPVVGIRIITAAAFAVWAVSLVALHLQAAEVLAGNRDALWAVRNGGSRHRTFDPLRESATPQDAGAEAAGAPRALDGGDHDASGQAGRDVPESRVATLLRERAQLEETLRRREEEVAALSTLQAEWQAGADAAAAERAASGEVIAALSERIEELQRRRDRDGAGAAPRRSQKGEVAATVESPARAAKRGAIATATATAAEGGVPPRHLGSIGAAGPHDHAAAADEGISACLLVNDENPRLPEWIAYHYLVLPLRALIVAVDPASRSSPHDILVRWLQDMGLYVTVWSEKQFLPKSLRGPCASDDPDKCLWHHRDRQQYFVMKCMAEHKRANRTWVLLTDVDEYLLFNQVRDDDPPIPLDAAPEGVPTMEHWKFRPTGQAGRGRIDGTVAGRFTTSDVVDAHDPRTTVEHGHVVRDAAGHRYFLRDDVGFLEATALLAAPPGVPTLKDPFFAGDALYARVHNDTYDGRADGEFVPIDMTWKLGDAARRAFYGGHLLTDARGRAYYLENEQARWPPRLAARDALGARFRLPSIGDNATVLAVLRGEAREGYAGGALGPCLSVPRLLYGSREGGDGDGAAPEGFRAGAFVTLRHRWHAPKGGFEESKYGKTLIDVSRVPASALLGKALNIHRPLAYYCRKDPARYAVSLFRVNHYLDSFEAYSYRNDARANVRHCKECYEEKGNAAAVAMDNDIQPWLRRFVELVGHEKAQRLLLNAGDFVKLEEENN